MLRTSENSCPYRLPRLGSYGGCILDPGVQILKYPRMDYLMVWCYLTQDADVGVLYIEPPFWVSREMSSETPEKFLWKALLSRGRSGRSSFLDWRIELS